MLSFRGVTEESRSHTGSFTFVQDDIMSILSRSLVLLLHEIS
mgnify:CR=1 FL=1